MVAKDGARLRPDLAHSDGFLQGAFTCGGEIDLLYEDPRDESAQCTQIDGATKTVLEPWPPWLFARS